MADQLTEEQIAEFKVSRISIFLLSLTLAFTLSYFSLSQFSYTPNISPSLPTLCSTFFHTFLSHIFLFPSSPSFDTNVEGRNMCARERVTGLQQQVARWMTGCSTNWILFITKCFFFFPHSLVFFNRFCQHGKRKLLISVVVNEIYGASIRKLSHCSIRTEMEPSPQRNSAP